MLSMDAVDFNTYYEAITPIEAQEMLLSMKVISYPHMEKNSRQEFHKSIHKLAYPSSSRPVTRIDELEKILNAR